MNYLSVCSGIEAATQAWHPLEWKPVAFSEIEAFPSAVLAHHYPDVPNWGDMTKFKEWPDATVDVLVGGTPCQSFSVAGLRKGLDDPRGNLALTYLAIAARYRPRWVVWENVPGVLSSGGGRDFGSFLGGLGELGYGWAYRVLDAQYVRTRRFPFAVPQRRRRVFVVGHLGDWRRAAAVLLDPESMRRDSPPRREAGQGTAGVAAQSVASCLNAAFGSKLGLENQHINSGAPLFIATAIQERAVSENLEAGPQGKGWQEGVGYTLEARNKVQAVAFGAQNSASQGDGVSLEYSPTLDKSKTPAVAFDLNQITSKTNRSQPDPAVHHTLPAASCFPHLATPWAVRRLTPVECERLQAFPDNFTRIPYRNKPADQCPDGPRYKALGNSMAVNVMDFIGQRIAAVEEIAKEMAA